MVYTHAALRWLESVFKAHFGQPFTLTEHDDSSLVLTLEGHGGSIVFDTPEPLFGRSESRFPCFHWDARAEGFFGPVESTLPAPASSATCLPLVEVDGDRVLVHYDIPGLTFWMLTRKEEIGRTDLDEHQRFPSAHSHASLHGYLERPVVDEWLCILRQIIQRVWPRIPLTEHTFGIQVSHDVDRPGRYAFKGFKGLIRAMAGDALLRRDPLATLTAPWIWLSGRQSKSLHPRDPFNTFDWLMDRSEENGMTSAFYFICGRTDPVKDALYDPEMPAIRALMRRIHQRGHEIGLHPSYETYHEPDKLAAEAARLRRVCAEEGITQRQWGGRMHYLRWDQAVTLKAWDDAGMTYDSTLTYADRPGFRCGTCFEYPAFDVVNDRALALRVRPLVAMEGTVIADHYLGLGATEAAFRKFEHLKNRCRQVNGTYTLLWHNSFFDNEKYFEIYRRLLDH
mgnify:CR=1 FL=1|tara:strand:+ start:42280 stop:43638 length:1359 start_codon:yes stop_codon:yes gene_type:complete